MLQNDEYLESRVLTASPQQLHLMVVEAAIRHALRGQAALEEQNFESANEEFSHSRNFVSEMISGLNTDQAEELTEQLKAMFSFCYRRLVEADLHHDTNAINDAVQILQMHRDTWMELMESLVEEAPTPEQADAPEEWESGSVSWTG